jgi:hypothetical protein
MSQVILKSVRGKRTLYFAGWSPKNVRKPRFTPKPEDAMYLQLSSASTIRDNLSDKSTKVFIVNAESLPTIQVESNG